MISEIEYQARLRAAQEGKLKAVKVKVSAKETPAHKIKLLEKQLQDMEKQIKDLQFEKVCLEEENEELSRDADNWRQLRETIMKDMRII